MSDTIVIWNAAAGRADAALAAKEELLRRNGVAAYEVRTRSETVETARRAADQGAQLVIAAGGDGTINAVVNGLMTAAHRPTLGVLPVGTANDFARTLAMPLDPAEAVQFLDATAARPLDVVQALSDHQTNFFINMATAGNSERVIEELTPEQKRWWGPLCYLRGALDVALDLESYAVSVVLDNELPRSYSAWNLILANGRTSAAGLHVAPLASPEDGMLDVIVVLDGTLPDLLEIGARLWFDTFLDSDLVKFHRAKSVQVWSDPPLSFTADGDLVEWVPAAFEVHAAALDVVVGPEYEPRPVAAESP